MTGIKFRVMCCYGLLKSLIPNCIVFVYLHSCSELMTCLDVLCSVVVDLARTSYVGIDLSLFFVVVCKVFLVIKEML